MLLETIWFILWGVLWGIYFMLDGFDFGIGTLMPFIAADDTDRRIMYNAMGPYWDGNEVWLITAGGVTFAAFPTTYAVMFSTLYTPLLLILFALIVRAAAFEFRAKVDSPGWRSLWDACLFIGSFAPALLFGVAFANIFQGIPFNADYVFEGNLFTLLNPYGIAGGVFFVIVFIVHGALWLAVKTEGTIQTKAAGIAFQGWNVMFIGAVVFLAFTYVATPLYNNYFAHPVLFVIPLIAVVGLVLMRLYIAKNAWWSAWFASSLTILAVVMFGVVGLYPNLYPSSVDPALSLTIANSSSSQLTLKIMLAVALVFVPIVIAYQVWAYHLFRDKVTSDHLQSEESY
jgi:cytochrome bd ubiquinol oxidase subunit II